MHKNVSGMLYNNSTARKEIHLPPKILLEFTNYNTGQVSSISIIITEFIILQLINKFIVKNQIGRAHV